MGRGLQITYKPSDFGLERQKYEKSLLVLHCYVMSNVLALRYYDACKCAQWAKNSCRYMVTLFILGRCQNLRARCQS